MARPTWPASFLSIIGISIHAPLTWRDFSITYLPPSSKYFNPRATYVARRADLQGANLHDAFQSTRHLRGATCPSKLGELFKSISIHAPLTWRDSPKNAEHAEQEYFNPRATYVARPARARHWALPRQFQSTRHLRGATHAVDLTIFAVGDFNPRATYVARQGHL